MSKPKFYFHIIFLIQIVSCGERQNNPFQQFENANTPALLEKGVLSTDSIQWNNLYVHKTKELYYTFLKKNTSQIRVLSLNDGRMGNMKTINLPVDKSHSDIYVDPDGEIMLFSSTMDENDSIEDWNLWKSLRVGGGWGTPANPNRLKQRMKDQFMFNPGYKH